MSDFEAVQKTRSHVLSGLKTLGKYTPARFLNKTFLTDLLCHYLD